MKSDVLIIGGGVIGLAAALELLDAGRGVRILERERVGSGASHGNCGLITPSHALPLTRPGMIRKVLTWMLRSDSPIYVRPRFDLSLLSFGLAFARNCDQAKMLRTMRARGALLGRSRAMYSELVERGTIECEWEARGLLIVFSSQKALEAEAEADVWMNEIGVETRSLSSAELCEHEPALRDDLAGGTWFPEDAHLRPELLVSELERLVRARGGVIEENERVEALRTEAGRVTRVHTNRGSHAADAFLLATGAWSPELARTVGIALPVQPGKGYSITIRRPDPCPATPLVLAEPSMAVTPWPSGLRLGGTMEFAGYDSKLRRKRLDALYRGARSFLRADLNREVFERWSGWRPMTPTELPLIDRAPRLDNLWVATGHGMMGVSMAPATALLVRDLVTGSDSGIDPAPYRLEP